MTQLNDGIFKNISVAGQDLIIAENNQDTLNIAAGSRHFNYMLMLSTDTITINPTQVQVAVAVVSAKHLKLLVYKVAIV